jgi:hypothetical protein
MATTETNSDLSVGLGLLFSLVAVGAAVAAAAFSHSYAIQHAVGEASRALQVNSGVAIGVAMLAAGLAVMAIHAFEG